MAISVHLISVPSEEVVTSRVIHLPKVGGEFGRSPACDIALPDESKRISRVHGKITAADNGGYKITVLSQNRSFLNDKPLVRDKEYLVNDGDILKVENYSMLLSTMTSSSPEVTKPVDDDPFKTDFKLDLDDKATDFLDEEDVVIVEESPSLFSEKHILSDDPFAADPFEDIEPSKIESNLEVETPTTVADQNLEYLPIDAPANPNLEASIDKLISLTEKNQQYLQNPQLQHDALFSALEKTVDQFLDEFAPNLLEEQFSDFMSTGLFTSKDKKYWRIYRKHFQHRRKNGDFRRQFKALFMENMQKQSEESK